jgi:hypothetical protein
MPIVGPLREFGVHDVFQLLSLSRKTGVLTVRSAITRDEGFVVFEVGRVLHGGRHGQPSAPEDVLVSAGRVSAIDVEYAQRLSAERNAGGSAVGVLIHAGAVQERDVERAITQHIEGIVFELMSWRDGFFSFEERPAESLEHSGVVSISAESLVMESARRLDEWSCIAERVPGADVVATLAPDAAESDTRITLLPHEWLVLGMIDGERDIRAIAAASNQSVFDVAKVVYALALTGLVDVARIKSRV